MEALIQGALCNVVKAVLLILAYINAFLSYLEIYLSQGNKNFHTGKYLLKVKDKYFIL